MVYHLYVVLPCQYSLSNHYICITFLSYPKYLHYFSLTYIKLENNLFCKFLGTHLSQNNLSFILIIISSLLNSFVSFLRSKRLHLVHIYHSPDKIICCSSKAGIQSSCLIFAPTSCLFISWKFCKYYMIQI